MNLLSVYCQDNSNKALIIQPKTFIPQPIYTPSETASDRADNSSSDIDSADGRRDRPDKNECRSDWSRRIAIAYS